MMVMGTGLGKTKDLKWDLKVYKQPSFSDPRFKHRTYVGDLWLGEKVWGLLIEIDENLLDTTGFYCDNPLSAKRDSVYRSYRRFQREYKIGGSLARHFDDAVTGSRTLIDPPPQWR